MTLRFDLRANADEFMRPSLTTEGFSSLRGAVAFDEVNERVYTVQNIDGGLQLPGETRTYTAAERQAQGDITIIQMTLAGDFTGQMYALGMGRGWGLGVEPTTFGGDVFLWTEAAAVNLGGFGWGTQVGRFRWSDGATVRSATADVEMFNPTPGQVVVIPTLDLAGGRIAIRHQNSAAPINPTYRVYTIDQFKARNFATTLGTYPVTSQGSWRGFCLFAEYIYQTEGGYYTTSNPPPGNHYISCHEMASSTTLTQVERVFITTRTDMGLRDPESVAVYRGAGDPKLVYSYTIDDAAPRRLVLFSVDQMSEDVPPDENCPPTREPCSWNPNDPRRRFRLTDTVHDFLPAQQMTEAGVVRYMAFDDTNQMVYASQTIEDGRQLAGESRAYTLAERQAQGDFCITEMTIDGDITGHMYVRGMGSGSFFGVEPVSGGGAYMVTEAAAVPVAVGQTAFGRQVARFLFTDGAVWDSGENMTLYNPPVIANMANVLRMSPVVDMPTDRIGVYYVEQLTGGGTATWLVTYNYTQFKASTFTAINRISLVSRGPGVFHSICLFAGYLYQNEGDPYSSTNVPPGNHTIACIQLQTNTLVEVQTITHRPDLIRREPKSVSVYYGGGDPKLVFNYGVGELPNLQNIAFNFDLPVDYPFDSFYDIVDAQVENPEYDYRLEAGYEPPYLNELGQWVAGNCNNIGSGAGQFPPCQQTNNPCCIPRYVEGTDWRLEFSSQVPGPVYTAHIAIHGGAIEPPTSQLAQEAATEQGLDQTVYYTFEGRLDSDNQELYIPSTQFDEEDGLRLVAGSARTVSWHGGDDEAPFIGLPATYITGLDTELGGYIASELRADGFVVANPPASPEETDGNDPDNITNKNRIRRGVQIEINETQRKQFYLNGDLRLGSIDNPGNRTPVFYAYIAAVVRGIRRLDAPGVLPGRPGLADDTLGCAQEYTAAVHWRGGFLTYITASDISPVLTDIQWERRLNETSQASITVAKRNLTGECCNLFGDIHPWCHELSIYREKDLVWQGPVVTVEEGLSTITIIAHDMTAWLRRLVNSTQLDWSKEVTVRVGNRDIKKREPVFVELSVIVNKLIRDNLLNSMARPYTDWPYLISDRQAGGMQYLQVENTGIRTKMMRRVPWVETVYKILESLIPKGLEFTCVGRRLVVRRARNLNDPTRGTFTPEDLPGGITVIRDGQDATTRVWATTQREGADGITVTTEVTPISDQVCGRLDTLIRNNDRIDLETAEEEDARHDALRAKRDANLDAISKKWEDAINKRKEQANKEIETCDSSWEAKVDQRKRQANNEVEACGTNEACKKAARNRREDDIAAMRKSEDTCKKSARTRRDNDVAAMQKNKTREADAERTRYQAELLASDRAVITEQIEVLAEILLAEARSELTGRWSIPMGIDVADGARLSPKASVRLIDLVPGEKFDVTTRGFCQGANQPMRLETVRGRWTQQGEEIGISVVPMKNLLISPEDS